jgi:hypothetical protein
VLFCAQPAYVEAVVWVGAITDLLPATWFLLTLWCHCAYRQTHRWPWRAASFATFVLGLGTHESAVTFLPMMLGVDLLLTWPANGRRAWLAARLRESAPFAAALSVFLVVAYVVNSRGYLVQEGHYAFGWHAFPNLLDYIASLYVGRRLVRHLGVVAVIATILWRGTPRMRFYVAWVIVTLVPVSFFTWGGASRYLYVPAVGFALLLADLVLLGGRTLGGPHTPQRLTLVLATTAFLVARFAVFAETGVDNFNRGTLRYDRLTAAVRAAAPSAASLEAVPVAARDLESIPELYRDATAETALCTAGIRIQVVPQGTPAR